MKKTAQKRMGSGLMFSALLLLLLTALGWQLHRLQGQVSAAQSQQAQLEQEVAQLRQENDALQREHTAGGDQEQMEQIARDELGLLAPGEKVFHIKN